MQPEPSGISVIGTRERNRAALVLFGRAAVTTLGIVSGGLGFLTGIELQRANYNPYSTPPALARCSPPACAVIALLLMRRRLMADNILRLEAQVAELTDCVGSCARPSKRRKARATRPGLRAAQPGSDEIAKNQAQPGTASGSSRLIERKLADCGVGKFKSAALAA